MPLSVGHGRAVPDLERRFGPNPVPLAHWAQDSDIFAGARTLIALGIESWRAVRKPKPGQALLEIVGPIQPTVFARRGHRHRLDNVPIKEQVLRAGSRLLIRIRRRLIAAWLIFAEGTGIHWVSVTKENERAREILNRPGDVPV